MQMLLKHLRVDASPLTSDAYLRDMLGRDTLTYRLFELVYEDSWGVYFNADEGRSEHADEDVKLAEKRFLRYQRALHQFE